MKPIQYMIADDHKIFRKGVIFSLSDYPDLELVGEAENGKQIIELLTGLEPDVILMDLKMPEMDGIEATQYIHQHYPLIRVLILSMYDDEKFIVHLMENGAAGYLLKNSEPDEIKNAISGAVMNGYYFTDLVNRAMLKKIVTHKQFKPTFKDEIQLTEREMEVLHLICEEHTAPEIAKMVYLSPRTVEGIRGKLIEKIGVKNTAGLVMYAVRNGLIN
ncbi:MAG: response regulator transcription factor [Chitinophagaceae bacterium]